MNIRSLILSCFFLLLGTVLLAQKKGKDPVLFSVQGTPVYQSEFDYIYQKTNGEKADYSLASLEEYLDLYLKFKLKVARARELQLDTIPALQTELQGYRRTLADSYLLDKEVTERLVREVFDRRQQDVDISHILVSLPKEATGRDTVQAFTRAMEARQALKQGKAFEEVAREYSNDRSVARNKGHIGYVTALFPDGFYNLESKAYSLPVGVYSDPIRTDAGYHILQVHDRRKARGEVEVAHILIRKGTEDAQRKTIDSLQTVLRNGGDFDALAKKYSQDKKTSARGGYLGYFGINTYQLPFEDAAFALTSDGQISAPIKTSSGYHLIKRISRKDISDYNKNRGLLTTQVKKDARYEAARRSMLNRIKETAGFAQNEAPLKSFIDTVGDNFTTYKWKPGSFAKDELLFAIGDERIMMSEFMDFLQRSARKRIRMGRQTPPATAVRTLYADFMDEQLMAYEERQLENRYPEFKALMREYEEGILLFEATKLLVWDKASQDTLGLQQFYNTTDKEYRWNERAESTVYSVRKDKVDQIGEIRLFAADHSPQEVVAKFNQEGDRVVSYTRKTYERGTNEDMDRLDWASGTLSPNGKNASDGAFTFTKIEQVLPPAKKTLAEARGYVIADYQDHLEKQWVKELRSRYKVEMNEKVLKEMSKRK